MNNNRYRAGEVLRFISHDAFVKVELSERHLTLRQRIKVLLTGRVLSAAPSPHPDVVQVAPNAYFGHPDTIEQMKAELQAQQRQAAKQPAVRLMDKGNGSHA